MKNINIEDPSYLNDMKNCIIDYFMSIKNDNKTDSCDLEADKNELDSMIEKSDPKIELTDEIVKNINEFYDRINSSDPLFIGTSNLDDNQTDNIAIGSSVKIVEGIFNGFNGIVCGLQDDKYSIQIDKDNILNIHKDYIEKIETEEYEMEFINNISKLDIKEKVKVEIKDNIVRLKLLDDINNSSANINFDINNQKSKDNAIVLAYFKAKEEQYKRAFQDKLLEIA